ncbi:hypothetical protein Aeh1ORF279c [Aeromonas phage Aeh1]|uniref:Uncharacterized protein n=1 Tax=Aeromonas phage Aeh1 TaxID=2880362 RepID=Q76YF1_9CAUD|nr:hypothetical protein Aeh1p294 [Aeromonas phage Aeh1]AAQ17944.1 hypothetical protein Aeh1ORF279c [Aeromonas phage Aeh1]
MTVMKIGANYEFKNTECMENYRDAHRINRGVAEAIQKAGGVFRITEGEINGNSRNSEGDNVDEVMTSITDVNGNVVFNDRGATLISESEMNYFQVAAVKVEVNPDEAFAKTSFEKLMAIYKSYHPDTPDSKITVVNMRKSWDLHNKNILELEEKIDILTKTLAQRKEML